METINNCPLLESICPHSLGTLIEWKLDTLETQLNSSTAASPHSLGTLIEWKLIRGFKKVDLFCHVPTRWGH